MKKTVLVLLALLVAIPLFASADTLTFARPLSVGSEGKDVSALQQYLKTEGYFTYPTITGFFGSVTKNAVYAFQKAHGLEQVGSVGPKTRAILNGAVADASANTIASGAQPPATSVTTPICTAPAGLTCVPGTNMIQPYAPSNGYTPGFGGGGGTVAVSGGATPSDTQAPSVSIVAPAAAATVAGSVTLSASASDNTGVAGVTFYINGVKIGTEDTSAPYSIVWDSTATSSGSKTITAVARDAAGNTAVSAGVTVTLDNGTVYFNNQFFSKGSYSSYPGMWFLNVDPTLALGHTAVEGVDYESNIRVFTSTFPNNTIIRTRIPNFPPTGAGVYGYQHVAYGNYDGDSQQVPITPRQVYQLTSFTNDINWTTTGTSSNLLNEFYLTSVSGDASAKLFEIGVFPNAPSTTQAFVNGNTQIGLYTDAASRVWKVTRGGNYITFFPNDLQNVNGTIYWKDMLAYLIAQGQITGNEWINGVGFGIEPYTGAATTTINTFSVSFAGAARVPWTITDLSVTALSTTTAQLAFNTGAGATSYQYRVNGGSAISLPANKIATTTGGDTVEVIGINGTGSSGWSNVATVPNPRLSLDFISGTYRSGGTSYGTFASYLSGAGSTFARSGVGGYDTAITQLFSNNVARITGAGLLMEPTSTNYVIQSQFASGWGASQSTLTANATTSPLGTNTAATLKEDATASADHQATQFSMTSGTATGRVVLSLFAKRGVGVRNAVAFMFDSGFNSAGGAIDLGTGAAGGFANSPFSNGAYFSSLINGYWRFGFAADHAADTSFSLLASMRDSTGSTPYNGDNTSIVNVFGYQMEQGLASGYFSTHPSSYIPTTSAAATRGGDQLKIALPGGLTSVTVTYDDNSTQTFTGLSGTWLVPTAQLNRPQIKSIIGI